MSGASLFLSLFKLADGEVEYRFTEGNGHPIAAWRSGDGISVDNVFVEEPKLIHFVNTTPNDRCISEVIEMIAPVLASALLAGSGNGELKKFSERFPEPQTDEFSEEPSEDESVECSECVGTLHRSLGVQTAMKNRLTTHAELALRELERLRGRLGSISHEVEGSLAYIMEVPR